MQVFLISFAHLFSNSATMDRRRFKSIGQIWHDNISQEITQWFNCLKWAQGKNCKRDWVLVSCLPPSPSPPPPRPRMVKLIWVLSSTCPDYYPFPQFQCKTLNTEVGSPLRVEVITEHLGMNCLTPAACLHARNVESWNVGHWVERVRRENGEGNSCFLPIYSDCPFQAKLVS